MVARISPAQHPFSAEIQERLDRVMPKGIPPLALFTSLARDKDSLHASWREACLTPAISRYDGRLSAQLNWPATRSGPAYHRHGVRMMDSKILGDVRGALVIGEAGAHRALLMCSQLRLAAHPLHPGTT